MILWAELAAWIVRAALISWWLSAGEIFAALKTSEQGFVRGTLIVVVSALLLNIIVSMVSGKPKIISGKKIPNDTEEDQYFSLNTLDTLKFLLQGSKIREVERNIAVLSGLKKVYLSSKGNYLLIEDAQPIKKVEYFKTIIVIIGGIVLLIIAPVGIIKIHDLIGSILLAMGFSKDFARFIIFTSSFTVLFHYFNPYTLNNTEYQNSTAVMFSKRIEVNDANVYESPMMPFLPNFPLGMYLNGKIIINPFISNNQKILQYVIAHEEGHISDLYCKIKRKLFSLVFPWLVYIIAIIISYFVFIGKLHYNFWLILILAGLIGSLIFLIFIIIFIKSAQYVKIMQMTLLSGN
ncbi:hypothetical protein [Carboxydothermus pertinax]|uniref:Uncharacterized protein n=1 Tax=Carboxydothermus pertinax TaxID=870242 RepID=A0A1L8CW84_9THEO|nr:hypothetical protein [Carboxydothermus pertinax]GAV23180.1 hypothetical protein cpu_16900 [Carboxydothermus pertinax]